MIRHGRMAPVQEARLPGRPADGDAAAGVPGLGSENSRLFLASHVLAMTRRESGRGESEAPGG